MALKPMTQIPLRTLTNAYDRNTYRHFNNLETEEMLVQIDTKLRSVLS